MDDCQIIITRANSLYGCALKHTVEVDGFSVGVLKNGSTLVESTVPGNHTVSFVARGKVEKSVSVLINPENPTIRLFAKLNGRQKLEITKESYGAQTTRQPLNENATQKKGKHPILKTICIIFGVFIAIGVITSLGDNASKSQPVSLQSTEPTNEEKAADQLKDATTDFESGNYRSAIEVCKDIVAEYPATATSTNMGAYLKDRYSKFPHSSATDLMHEYDANIVNADKQYTDTVMVVSGIVSSVGKTNSGSNLTVLLESGTYFYGVQLNFDTDQTDAVAALKAGDSVTAIGKCTGESGKVLVVVDGKNVMIENCYLIDG